MRYRVTLCRGEIIVDADSEDEARVEAFQTVIEDPSVWVVVLIEEEA